MTSCETVPIILFSLVEEDNIQAAWTPPATTNLGQNNFSPKAHHIIFVTVHGSYSEIDEIVRYIQTKIHGQTTFEVIHYRYVL